MKGTEGMITSYKGFTFAPLSSDSDRTVISKRGRFVAIAATRAEAVAIADAMEYIWGSGR